MASPVGDIVVRIGADLSDLSKSVKKAQGELAKLGAGMRKGINIAGQWASAMTAAGAAMAAALVWNAGKAAREIDNLSRVANANAEEFQRNAYAAQFAGVETKKLADIYKDVGDKIGDFLNTGGGPMADFFEKIAPQVGVTAEQFRHLSGPDALQLYVKSLEAANISQSEMTFYMEAIASDATMLLPLLRNNGEEMRTLGDEAERLGKVLSAVEVQQLVAADNAIRRIVDAVKGLGQQVAVALTPYITEAANRMGDLAVGAGGFRDQIQTAFEVGIKGAAYLANGLHGLRVVFKGLELLVTGFGATVATVFELATREVFGFASKVNSAVNAAIVQLNRLPKVDIDLLETDASQFGAVKFATTLGDAMREQVGIVRSELHELAMQELPSQKVEEFLKAVEKSSIEAAQAVVEARQTMAGGTGGVSHQDDLAAAEEQKQIESLQGRLDRLREYLMTESELESVRYQERFALLQEALETELVTEGEYQKLKEEMWLQHQERLTQIEREGLTERQKFEQMSLKSKVKTVAGHLTELTAGVAMHNRKMFEANKIAGIANAIINAHEGISKTLSAYPYPINVGMAAAHAAAAFAQVSAIKSASFGGGSAPSIAGSTPAPPVTPVTSGAPSAQGGRLAVEGLDPSAMFSGAQMRELAERLQEHIKDGGTLVFV